MAEAAGIEPMLTGAGTVPKRYRGVPVPSWFHDATSQKLEGMALRDTDVVLASWPKAGTHWLFKALRLLSGASEGDMTLVEMLPPAAYDPSSGAPPPEKSRWNPTGEDHFDALLEREAAGDFRILVTHAPADWLPFKAGQTGGGKLVYVTRNPRDVVVSNYFFLGTPKDGWDGSMNRFLVCMRARACHTYMHACVYVYMCLCVCVCARALRALPHLSVNAISRPPFPRMCPHAGIS